ncbi:serine hydrolase domain-containing protein [Streptomyces sp. JNUCC 64]
MDSDSKSVRGIDRRRLFGWGGRAAAGVAAGVPLVGAGTGHAHAAPTGSSGDDRIPGDTLPGGAFDQYVARLAAQGRFSGVVLLSHRGRTVLSRGYGMADEEKGIPNREGTAFSLSSAGKPFHAVAVSQLAQQGRLRLSDPVGAHLTGFAKDVAEQVTIHHLLSGTSRLGSPDEDVRRVFQSRDEVHEHYARRARQARLVGVPGTPRTGHSEAEVTMSALIVEAVAGTTYWDYVQENIFERCGMTGSAFFTRPQWLTDPHIAHPYAVGGLPRAGPFGQRAVPGDQAERRRRPAGRWASTGLRRTRRTTSGRPSSTPTGSTSSPLRLTGSLPPPNRPSSPARRARPLTRRVRLSDAGPGRLPRESVRGDRPAGNRDTSGTRPVPGSAG